MPDRLASSLALLLLWSLCWQTPARADTASADKSAPPSAEQVEAWRQDLTHDSRLTRRAAARQLLNAGDIALAALVEAAGNDDALVRRVAITGLATRGDDASLAVTDKALGDEAWLVRLAAVNGLAAQSPRSDRVESLLTRASQDEQAQVRQRAIEALWPYAAPPQAVRDRRDLDYDLRSIQVIKLPATGWKFITDPRQTGHRAKWFDVAFDDTDWQDFQIEKVWGDQGHPGYSGVAWYRLTFTLPERPDHDGVDLILHGVDNSAWVWLNGQFIAAHDIGPAGWDKVVTMEVTPRLQWGKTNQITVRVRNGPYAGGIYKPVTLDILKR